MVVISGVQPSRSTFRAERCKGGIDEKTYFVQLARRHREGAPEKDVPGPKDAILKADEAQRETVSKEKPAKGGSQHFSSPGNGREAREPWSTGDNGKPQPMPIPRYSQPSYCVTRHAHRCAFIHPSARSPRQICPPRLTMPPQLTTLQYPACCLSIAMRRPDYSWAHH